MAEWEQRAADPCQKFVAQKYERHNPKAPETYGNCRNCRGGDPISLEPIQDISLNQLLVLPSGNCVERKYWRDLRGVDPISRQLLGGKRRKSRKVRKSRKARKTKRSRKSIKAKKAKKSKKSRKYKK